jgi:anti-sigma regulatory factor (Ser/Thr protein kinase)
VGLTAPLRFEVRDSSSVAPIRRAVAGLAARLDFSDEVAGRASLVATELATNLVRHTSGGEIVLRAEDGTLDVVAWDRGPGMRDVEQSLVDGFSTAGGAGTGLGAVRRLADRFDLNSLAPGGTIVTATVGGNGELPSADGLVLAVAPEVVSGDAWATCAAVGGSSLMLADGLGHGPDAAEASERACAALRPAEPVETTLERVHAALRPTRGAAVAVARVDEARGVLQFAGVGNVSAVLCTRGSSKALTSLSGTAGRQVRTIRSFEYPLPDSGLLVMHSDGCRTGWDLDADPGLRRKSPLLIAATLIRDWERGRDDVSVVVLALPDRRA